MELTRPAGTHAVLGITLVQRDSEGQSLICVKRLKAGGLASRDGRLRRGDAILQVSQLLLWFKNKAIVRLVCKLEGHKSLLSSSQLKLFKLHIAMSL